MGVITPTDFNTAVETALSSNQDVYSVKIVKEDDKTYDIRIWDERENERREELEEGHFNFYGDAFRRLIKIFQENTNILFIRAEDEID